MIRMLIHLYILILIADTLFSYFPKFQHQPWVLKIKKLANFTLVPIRKLLPADLPFDFSSLIAIVLFELLIVLW